MDDKKVKELIREYAAISRSDPAKDIRKYYAGQKADARKTKNRWHNKKLIWSGLAVALVVLIAFSVMLPLYFAEINKGDTPGGVEPPGETHFYSDDALDFVTIESVDAFNEQYGCAVKAVSGNASTYTYKVISIKNDGGVIGLEILLEGVGEIIISTKFTCYLGEDRITSQDFSDLQNEAAYNMVTVNYDFEIVNETYYVYHIAFAENGLYYTLAVYCSSEAADVTALLDEIFNDQNGGNGDDSDEDDIHYGSDDIIQFKTIDSVESFNEQYDCAVKTVNPNGMFPPEFKVISDTENGEIYGLSILMDVCIEPIINARMICYTGNGRIQDVNFFDLKSEAQYEGAGVKYRFDSDFYIYYIAYSADGVCYNIEVTCFSETDNIKTILDLLFGV